MGAAGSEEAGAAWSHDWLVDWSAAALGGAFEPDAVATDRPHELRAELERGA